MIYKNKYVQIISAVIIVAGLSWFIYSDLKIEALPEDNISQDDKTITKDGIGVTLSEGSIEDVEIKQIPVDMDVADGGAITQEELVYYPNLDYVTVFPESFSEDARVIIQNNISTLTAQLKEDQISFPDWLDLSTQYKIIEDYERTRDILEFLNIAFIKNSVSFRNLGNLYGYYLNDPQKAEENLLQAIENGPTVIEYYFKITEFYRDIIKAPEKARQIVEQGIETNPFSAELTALLSSLN